MKENTCSKHDSRKVGFQYDEKELQFMQMMAVLNNKVAFYVVSAAYEIGVLLEIKLF